MVLSVEEKKRRGFLCHRLLLHYSVYVVSRCAVWGKPEIMIRWFNTNLRKSLWHTHNISLFMVENKEKCLLKFFLTLTCLLHIFRIHRIRFFYTNTCLNAKMQVLLAMSIIFLTSCNICHMNGKISNKTKVMHERIFM